MTAITVSADGDLATPRVHVRAPASRGVELVFLQVMSFSSLHSPSRILDCRLFPVQTSSDGCTATECRNAVIAAPPKRWHWQPAAHRRSGPGTWLTTGGIVRRCVDRLEVLVGGIAIHRPRHWRQNGPRRAHVPAGTNRAQEHVLSPNAEAGVLIRREVRRIADAPRSVEGRVGRRRSPRPGRRLRRRRQGADRFGVAREAASHVRLGAVWSQLERCVAIVAAHDGDQILAPLRAIARHGRRVEGICRSLTAGCRKEGGKTEKEREQRKSECVFHACDCSEAADEPLLNPSYQFLKNCLKIPKTS